MRGGVGWGWVGSVFFADIEYISMKQRFQDRTAYFAGEDSTAQDTSAQKKASWIGHWFLPPLR